MDRKARGGGWLQERGHRHPVWTTQSPSAPSSKTCSEARKLSQGHFPCTSVLMSDLWQVNLSHDQRPTASGGDEGGRLKVSQLTRFSVYLPVDASQAAQGVAGSVAYTLTPGFPREGQGPKPGFNFRHLVQALLEVVYFSEGLSWGRALCPAFCAQTPEVWMHPRSCPSPVHQLDPRPLAMDTDPE